MDLNFILLQYTAQNYELNQQTVDSATLFVIRIKYMEVLQNNLQVQD